MKNRAKCKLCGDIIESYHSTDFVPCKCGHISVDGGSAMKCAAIDWNNFLRVDDKGNEIQVIIKDENKVKSEDEFVHRPSKSELIKELDYLREFIDMMPEYSRHTAITHSDFSAFLTILSAILRSD